MPSPQKEPPSISEGIEIRDWSRMSAELMLIYDDYIKGEHLRMRQHLDDHAAILIREGSCSVEIEGKRAEASAGDWIILPRRMNRFQVFTPGSRVLSIHFLLSWPGGMPVYDWNSVLVIASREIPELEARGKRLERIVAMKAPDAGRRIRSSKDSISGYFKIHWHFLQWLETFCSAMAAQGINPIRQGKIDPRVLKIVQLLDRHPFHIPLPQAELALQVNLSAHRLTRLFKEQFKMTPAAYFDQRRGREAYNRVQNTKDSFKEIAYDLGFYSPSHFSTWFTKSFHQTPSEVRLRHPGVPLQSL